MQPNYTTNDYNIYFVDSNNKDFYFPYIFCVPKHLNNEGALSLYVETNNEEKSEKLIDSAEFTTRNVLNMMRGSANKSPIFIPILPTNGKDARPYFQQLSNECFNTNLPTGEQRIDLQVKKLLKMLNLNFMKLQVKN